MAMKKISSGNSTKKRNSKNNADSAGVSGFRRLFVIFFLLLALALLGGIIFLICVIPGKMMYNNPRFKLERVEVHGPGYWKSSKGIELITKLGFALGENLFSLDAGKIRQNARNNISNIEDADVSFILPDMIVFRIRERIPVAQVLLADNLDEEFVADEKGKLFKKSESSADNRKLPMITGETDNQKMLLAALKLISTANREYKDIRISEVNLDHDSLKAFIVYGSAMSDYEVWFPIDGDFKDLLHKLQNIIIQAYLRNQHFDNPIDLRFRDQATIKM